MNPYCHSVDPFAESSPWNLSGILALSNAPRAPHPASTGAVHDQRGGWSPHGYIGRHRVENSSVDGVVSRCRWFYRIPRRVENDADNWPGRHALPPALAFYTINKVYKAMAEITGVELHG